MKYQLVLELPKGQRIGQTLYNFLFWLGKKGYRFEERTGELADTYSLNDKKLMEYYNEWLKTLK